MADTTAPVPVLHVETDPAVAEMTADCLEREHDRFTITTVTTASEAVVRLADEEFDCIVSDYDLPEQDGIEFLERIRGRYPDLPFILFTGKGGEGIASDAVAAGVTDYLQKGSESDQYALLANRITNAVSQYRTQKEAAETEQQLRELTAITNDVLWMFTSDWDELLLINTAYEDIWGRSTEQLAEHPTDFLHGVHPDDREQTQEAMEQLSAGGSVDFEIRVNPGEDFQRWVWIQGEPITDDAGTVVRVAGFVRDITNRKEREQKLERQNERLDKFTSVASHDLRSPLAVAQGRLELAQTECDSPHLESAADAVNRAFALVDDLLALAREGGHDSEIDTVVLADLTEECWQYVETADATLVIETDQTIRADESRLRQLLENLIRNAVEHGGKDVRITVGDLDETPGFYVADDGAGIPEVDRDRVFEPGYTTVEDGTGFGLAIVTEVVDAHDWEIDLTDSENGGTRFEVTGVEFV